MKKSFPYTPTPLFQVRPIFKEHLVSIPQTNPALRLYQKLGRKIMLGSEKIN